MRAAALEFRERLERSEKRTDAVWNEAVRECMDLAGPQHEPKHSGERCAICWMRDRLRKALRLESPGYVPIKERMKNSLTGLKDATRLRGLELSSYLHGLDDAMEILDGLLEDFE